MMTTQEIANQLAEYCRKGEFEEGQRALYADNAISIEPAATAGYEKETKGLPALQEKIKKFMASIGTSHSNEVSKPLVTDSAIAFILTMDVTMKDKPRSKWSEICVYQVKDGKVISEQFFS